MNYYSTYKMQGKAIKNGYILSILAHDQYSGDKGPVYQSSPMLLRASKPSSSPSFTAKLCKKLIVLSCRKWNKLFGLGAYKAFVYPWNWPAVKDCNGLDVWEDAEYTGNRMLKLELPGRRKSAQPKG